MKNKTKTKAANGAESREAKNASAMIKLALQDALQGLQASRDTDIKMPGNLKRRRLRRFLQICRLLNKSEVDLFDLVDHAKWLAKHKYGRFNLMDTATGCPTLIGLARTRLNRVVELEFTPAAEPYLQFIFCYPENEVNLPPFVMAIRELPPPAVISQVVEE